MGNNLNFNLPRPYDDEGNANNLVNNFETFQNDQIPLNYQNNQIIIEHQKSKK